MSGKLEKFTGGLVQGDGDKRRCILWWSMRVDSVWTWEFKFLIW